MNSIRPRCCKWLPLVTQQLRLRNLVRIEGFNIECSDDESNSVLIYYTLHRTNSKDDEAFYKSEALPRRHLQQKWAEIDCQSMIKSNANCVCVKVWAHFDRRPPTSAFSESNNNNFRPTPTNNVTYRPDKLLFTWGVYFSGLMLLSQETEFKCRPNSLIFQINSHYFASPDYFTADNLREQLSLSYQRYSTSIPKDNAIQCDEFAINSPQVSRSSSPITVITEQDLKNMSQRYIQLDCNRSDVRRSYNLQQLLQLQQKQRLHLQLQRDIIELETEIKQRSVRCITKDQLHSKPRTTSLSSSSSTPSKNYHSMGRTLTILLAEEQQIDPLSMLRAQKLQMQVETLRCRQRLLKVEHETYQKRIAHLKKRYKELIAEREQRQDWLRIHHQQLQNDCMELKASKKQQLAQLQTKRNLVHSVERRMSALCIELCEIYPIGRNQLGFHTICGIPLPNLDAYVNNAKYAHSVSMDYVTPMALSAVLGYLAHLVKMVAFIMSRPMRNPILYEGSRTRIMDVVKEIQTSREFPLYCRSSIPTKPVKYAIYLLNQNIAQLCYDVTGVRCELRATIENMLSIFNTLKEIEQNLCDSHAPTRTHPHNRLTVHSHGTKGIDSTDYTLSKSHSSVDMNNAPVPPSELAIKSALMPNSLPISIPNERNHMQQQRTCRSVGSYTDSEDDFNHGFSNSDSNIMSQSGPNVM